MTGTRRYLVLDPCYDSGDVVRSLESELNALADEGWRVVAVVPVRSFRRLAAGAIEVSDDSIDTLVMERHEPRQGDVVGDAGDGLLALETEGQQGPGG